MKTAAFPRIRTSLCCAFCLVTLFLAAGCATQVKVFSKSPAPAGGKTSQYPWWADEPMHRELVRHHRLGSLIRRDPGLALHELHRALSGESEMEQVAAVASLTLRYGQRLERTQPQQALGLYLGTAALGYRHMVVQDSASFTNPCQIRLRESYNRGTAGVVSLLQELPGGMRTNHSVSACGQSFLLTVETGDAASSPYFYDRWLPADQWQQRGLAHHHRNDGLGARLIANRTNRQVSALELHLPDEGIFFPSTAILRFQSADESPGRTQKVQLFFYHPSFNPQIELGGRPWPLAADFTLPGAMLLARTRPLFKTRWSALLRPGETSRPPRLYLFEAYSPDRIPIIMVHGLRSTPITWQQLTNELLGDPEIRRHYQIWHYLYPTGQPFLTSAAEFRDELEAVRRMLDPNGRDFATQNMIVIGHSMGGLLARTLVTDSGDALWNSTFALSVSELDPGSEQLLQLRRIFYFQSKPYIKRAIFMAVPHRGSKAAEGLFARMVARRVRLPDDRHKFISSLRADLPTLLKPEAAPLFDRGYPDSISVLSPTTPSLIALAELPVNADTPFHSIIGDRGLGGGEKSTDGVVRYASSHLPGASSEVLVPASHRTYENPEAIAEVKRILKLHVAEIERSGAARRPMANVHLCSCFIMAVRQILDPIVPVKLPVNG
jgi:pimeloyl-ACP methyl ester carboxylesterase